MMNRMKLSVLYWFKSFDQSHLTMESLVSSAFAQLFLDQTLRSYPNFLPEQLNVRLYERLQFRKNPTRQRSKMSPGESCCFLMQKTFEVVGVSLSGTRLLHFHYGNCWNHYHYHSRKTQSQQKLCQNHCLKNAKYPDLPCK